jgi:outer membrane protein assembly factor BamB
MSQQPDHFSPKTVDEQIERLTQDASGQQETANQELVHHLHRFYQIQVAEKSAGSLDHAWERITHTQAYLKYEHTQTEQQGKNARRIRTMKTLPDPITDISYNDQDMMTPPTRRRRISRFVQSLVAVLLVGILVGSFFILFRSQHTTTGGSLQTHSIIVASTNDGTIYGVQPDSGTILWQHATGQALNGILPGESNITIQGKVVYGIEGNQAYALNTLNGTLLWQKMLDAPLDGYSLIRVDSDVVYISEEVSGGGAMGHMYALLASNGTVLWHHQAEAESLLTAANGIAYTYVNTVSGNTNVKAFGSKNGQFLWQYTTNAATGVVAHGTIYIYSGHQLTPGDNGNNKQDKSLLALNARTGKLLWSKPVIDASVNPLVIVKNMIIIGSGPNLNSSYHYCAYHTNDGSQIWCSESATVPAASNVTDYIAIGDTLYTITLPSPISSPSCRFEARNITNGSLLWSHPCAEDPSFSIVGLNETVFIAGGRNATISAFDSHGNLQKTIQLSNSDSIVSLATNSW